MKELAQASLQELRTPKRLGAEADFAEKTQTPGWPNPPRK